MRDSMTNLQQRVLDEAWKRLRDRTWFSGVRTDQLDEMADAEIEHMGISAAADLLVADTQMWDDPAAISFHEFAKIRHKLLSGLPSAERACEFVDGRSLIDFCAQGNRSPEAIVKRIQRMIEANRKRIGLDA